MPYTVRKDGKKSAPWCVYKKDTGEAMGCSTTKAKAVAHIRAMHANEKAKATPGSALQDSLQQRLWKIQDAFWKYLDSLRPPQPATDAMSGEVAAAAEPYPLSLVDVFDDHIIVRCWETDTYWKAQFIVDAETGCVTFQDEGEWAEVELKYVPKAIEPPFEPEALPDAEPVSSLLEFYSQKQADGRDRWVSISSTAFLDAHNEIVSMAGVDKGIARAKQSSPGPLLFWHNPNIRLGECDFQMRSGACLVESGLWDDSLPGKAAAKAVAEQPGKWGISIGFVGLVRNQVTVGDTVVKGVWEDLWFKERSVLPVTSAATKFSVIQSQSGGIVMEKAQVDALNQLVGGDLANEIASRVDEVNAEAAKPDAVVKEVGEPEAQSTPEATEETQPVETAEAEAAKDVSEPSAAAPAHGMADAVAAVRDLVGAPEVKAVTPKPKAAPMSEDEEDEDEDEDETEEGKKPPKKATKAQDEALLEALKSLQATVDALRTEVAAMKSAEAPKIAQVGPPAAMKVVGEGVKAQTEEVPRIVKSMTARLFQS